MWSEKWILFAEWLIEGSNLFDVCMYNSQVTYNNDRNRRGRGTANLSKNKYSTTSC